MNISIPFIQFMKKYIMKKYIHRSTVIIKLQLLDEKAKAIILARHIKLIEAVPLHSHLSPVIDGMLALNIFSSKFLNRQ